MDFSNSEHLLYFGIYCAVMCAVALFLFVTVFVVMGKGKRRCGALDITFRIFAVVCMIASATLLAASVLTSLDGAYRIEVGETASLVFGATAVELPMYGLFVALSAVGITELNAAVLIISVIALASDCLLANVKSGKKPKEAKKTEAQAKRDADIERIRRLADTAVQKTETACGATEKSVVSDDEDFDWRVDTGERKAEFVGLASADEDLDDDAFSAEEATDTQESEQAEDEPETDGFDDVAEDGAQAEDVDAKSDDASGYADDVIEETDGATEEIPRVARNDKTGDAVGSPHDGADEEVEDSDDDNVEENDAVDGSDESFGGFDGDDAYSFDPSSSVDDGAQAAADGDGDRDKDLEPNRDIYIPKIRTIVRKPAKVEQKPTAEQKPKKRATAAAKGGARSGGGSKSAKGRSAATKKPEAKPKTLPVTKRYVILDRTNAVNIFSEYLKERDKAGKDKLESNIDTIIIK